MSKTNKTIRIVKILKLKSIFPDFRTSKNQYRHIINRRELKRSVLLSRKTSSVAIKKNKGAKKQIHANIIL
ncbi:MAG: hypothetical protein ABIH00_07495 [Armatimonadota bacterium]